MKLLLTLFLTLIILCLLISGCSVTRPDRQEQGRVVSVDRVDENQAILMIKMKEGNVTYYQKLRGAGIGRWYVGDKYTIHFAGNTILKITKNE